jgi:hypothetical protein
VKALTVVATLALPALAGCVSVPPERLDTTRIGYGEVLQVAAPARSA